MNETTKRTKLREVPAFSVQSRQKNTVVKPLGGETGRSGSSTPSGFGPLCAQRKPLTGEKNVTTKKCPKSAMFRKMYDRGDFPIMIEHRSVGNGIKWKIPLEKVDIPSVLPLFFDGLVERQHPYCFLAEQGSREIVKTEDSRIVQTIPSLILPLRRVMDLEDADKMRMVLKLIQQLLQIENVGISLLPYYRQRKNMASFRIVKPETSLKLGHFKLLPVMSRLMGKNLNSGDRIEYGQKKREKLGDLILETFQLLEQRGGPNAYINIKYMVPTYQSCMGYN